MNQQQPDRFRGTPDDASLVAAMKTQHQGWWYSRWIGVMYGNVPVGIIAVVVIGIIWAIVQ